MLISSQLIELNEIEPDPGIRHFHWAIDEGTNSFANGFNVEFCTSDEATSNAAIYAQISCELNEKNNHMKLVSLDILNMGNLVMCFILTSI